MYVPPIIHQINPVVSRIPRRVSFYNGPDPEIRFIKAATWQCVADHLFPTKKTTTEDRTEALEFLESPDGDYILRMILGVGHAA